MLARGRVSPGPDTLGNKGRVASALHDVLGTTAEAGRARTGSGAVGWLASGGANGEREWAISGDLTSNIVNNAVPERTNDS